MGRRPNPVILNYFVRGPKLADNSNRYPHTCKLCGDEFPKGRIDSLTNHITKPGRCPAISEADRIQACLELHNIPNPNDHRKRNALQAGKNGRLAAAPVGSANWTALEALAEASRRVNMSEEQHGSLGFDHVLVESGQLVDTQFGFQTSPTSLEAPPTERQAREHESSPVDSNTPVPPSSEPALDAASLSVAAAATARMSQSYLDPQLVTDDVVASLAPATYSTPAVDDGPMLHGHSSDSWDDIQYLATVPIATAPAHHERPQTPVTVRHGGNLMSPGGGGSPGRPRRARFNAVRRREVQEVRKIGACIRCRILRKNCGKGDPCETCRKVLSPRVWKTGCIRTRLHEQLDLYSAGVQVVLAQRRYNVLKSTLRIMSAGTAVEGSQFPESGIFVTAPVFRALLSPDTTTHDAALPEPGVQALMIDCDSEDIPGLVDTYMHQILPYLVAREPSSFVHTMLRTASGIVKETGDALLQGALELWGLVDIIDRERQWKLVEKHPTDASFASNVITETLAPLDLNVYTIMCLQLNAAAERKANTTSKMLLNGMQRVLQDSKIKIGFPMFLTALLFLHCVEKSTWGFKAWEQEELRGGWPLERDPGTYTEQGENLANILYMLLSVRKVLPLTARSLDGKLVLGDASEAEVDAFYRAINLDCTSIPSSFSSRFPYFSECVTLTEAQTIWFEHRRSLMQVIHGPLNSPSVRICFSPRSSCSHHHQRLLADFDRQDTTKQTT
jgi:hypothetical protein